MVFQLEIPLETVVYAAKEASRLGKKVILDPAPAVPGLPEELLQSLYLIKPNETELSILTGRPHDPARLREDALSLQARGVKNVLVTLGGAGSYLLREDGTEARIPADSTVKVVDTTAAGDSYMGALAVALSQGKRPGRGGPLCLPIGHRGVRPGGADLHSLSGGVEESAAQ